MGGVSEPRLFCSCLKKRLTLVGSQLVKSLVAVEGSGQALESFPRAVRTCRSQ